MGFKTQSFICFFLKCRFYFRWESRRGMLRSGISFLHHITRRHDSPPVGGMGIARRLAEYRTLFVFRPKPWSTKCILRPLSYFVQPRNRSSARGVTPWCHTFEIIKSWIRILILMRILESLTVFEDEPPPTAT